MSFRTLGQDLLYGFRLLLKSPAFAIAGILTIAIGVGGTTGIFSIVNSVLLQPLPYRNADRLLGLTETDRERNLVGVQVSFVKLQRLQQNAHTLESVAGYFPTVVSLKTAALPEQVQAAQVSKEFFDVFGVTPEMGRNFLPQEDGPGGAPVAIISHRLWATHLDRDPHVLGRGISIEGKADYRGRSAARPLSCFISATGAGCLAAATLREFLAGPNEGSLRSRILAGIRSF
jgi:putative ABC transport system permease protein